MAFYFCIMDCNVKISKIHKPLSWQQSCKGKQKDPYDKQGYDFETVGKSQR